MHAKFIHDGEIIDYVPEAAVSAGAIVSVNDLVGVAKLDIPAKGLGALALTGVYDVVKGGDAFACGQKVYWDTVNSSAVKAAGANIVTLGVCAADAEAGDTAVRVRIG